ncbi:MAG: VWA domain-containing protein [Halothiobacillaceae bacterium]
MLLVVLAGFPGGVTAQEPAAPEIHLVIDVSGSMKRTDPDNLRRPALRILADLMPEEATAGAWFFGERVTGMMSPRAIDSAARDRLRGIARQVRSNEQFTDIAAALEAATENWPVAEEHAPRHVIFLSDGMVDISKDDEENAEARRRVMDEIIPMLQARRVHVHAIALSDGADIPLLRALAERTGALFETMQEADRLQRAFLHLFEAAAPRDSLPLEDNRFYVDGTVTELTILAFRAPDGAPTTLILPDGSRETVGTAARLEGWRWDDEGGRDLITIESPPTGEWQIEGALDPDNRAMIVTDLKIRGSTMPSRIYPGEQVEGDVFFTDGDRPITRKQFLDQMDVRILDEDMQGTTMLDIVLNDQGMDPDIIGGDGHFSYVIERDYERGQYGFVAQAVAPTFQRQWRQNFAIASHPPVEATRVRITPGEDEDFAPHWQIDLIPDPTLIETDSLEIDAQLVCGDSPPQSLAFEPAANAAYEATLGPEQSALACRAQIHVKGRMTFDRPIDLTLPAVELPPVEGRQARAEDGGSVGMGLSWPVILGVNVLGLALVAGTFMIVGRVRRRTLDKLVAGATQA